ncbi:MAG: hypothetical protein ABIZ80_19015, partial [Bryobacteraceae bacterium]
MSRQGRRTADNSHPLAAAAIPKPLSGGKRLNDRALEIEDIRRCSNGLEHRLDEQGREIEAARHGLDDQDREIAGAHQDVIGIGRLEDRHAGFACLLALLIVPVASIAAEPDWPRLEGSALELLQKYIRIESVNPPANTVEAANLIKDVLET